MRLAAESLLQLGGHGLEVGRRQLGAGPAGERLLAAQDPLLHVRRKAAGRLAHAAGHQVDDRLGKRQLALGVEHVLDRQVVGDQKQRHVADGLRRRA